MPRYLIGKNVLYDLLGHLPNLRGHRLDWRSLKSTITSFVLVNQYARYLIYVLTLLGTNQRMKPLNGLAEKNTLHSSVN